MCIKKVLSMRKLLTIRAATVLFLLFLAAGATDARAQEMRPSDVPPVAQPLVREGDFAVKLAAIYELGSPANETEAEDMLMLAGVVPVNGWLSDYPVTPEILGQLQESAVKAVSEGKLKMTAEEATRRLHELASQMQLPVPAGSGSGEAAVSKAPEQPVIYNYYMGYGPPIITYYPPPSAYLYLYVWVPYPVWWYGYWYPGFYICNNFTTTIVVDSRTVFVRNRYIDPVTRRVVRIDPVVRTEGGTVRSRTVLRTDDGRTYRNMREMRQGPAVGRVPDVGRGTHASRPPGVKGYQSHEDRRSAQEIYRRSIERQGTVGEGRRSGGGVVHGEETRRGPQDGGGSPVLPPQSDQRSYERRSGDVDRSTGSPGPPARSYEHKEREQSRQFQEGEPAQSDQESVNAPRPSRRAPDDDETKPGRWFR
jgi:hypothetical protein